MRSSPIVKHSKPGREGVALEGLSLGNGSQSNNVRVVARIRPMSREEERKGCCDVIQPILPEAKESFTETAVETGERSPSPSPRKTLRPFAFLTPLKKRAKEKGETPVHPNGRKKGTATPLQNNGVTPLIRNGQKEAKTPLPSAEQSDQHVQSLTVEKRRFNFDDVFLPSVNQKEVYDRSIGDSVCRNIFRGYNTTILAYGQTGSGKTYTMGGRNEAELTSQKDAPLREGKNLSKFFDNASKADASLGSKAYSIAEDDGIIPRAVDDLFRAKKRKETLCEVTIHLTYLEIYNDELRDLLADNHNAGSLKLRDHGDDGVVVDNLTTIEVKSVSQVSSLMEEAALRRTTGSTNMNLNSSRSHAVCRLIVTIKPKTKASKSSKRNRDTVSQVMRAKLTLVDLAGSERLKQTGVMGIKKKESININKDLFVLGKVISALADKGKKEGSSRRVANVHVPYRDSKLTRLLRDSLGGNCFTVMVACVSPASANMEESMNTLRYAERTRAITNTVKQNVKNAPLSPAESAAMRRENKLLKAKIIELKKRVQSFERERKAHPASNSPSGRETSLIKLDRLDSTDSFPLNSQKHLNHEEPKGQESTLDGLRSDLVRMKANIDGQLKEEDNEDAISILSYELSLTDAVEDLRGESFNFDEEVITKEELLEALEAQIDTKQDVLSSLQKEASTLQEKNDALLDLNKDLEQRNKELKDSLGEDSASVHSASYEYLESASRVLKMENRALSAENKDLLERIACNQSTLASLEEKLEMTKSYVQEAEAKVSENCMLTESKENVAPTPTPRKATRVPFQNVDEMNIELQSMTGKKLQSQNKRASQENDLRSLKEKLQKASHDITVLKTDLKSCKAQNTGYLAKLEEKDKQISNLLDQLNEEKKHKATYQDEVEKLSNERDSLRVKCAVLQDQYQRLEEDGSKTISKVTNEKADSVEKYSVEPLDGSEERENGASVDKSASDQTHPINDERVEGERTSFEDKSVEANSVKENLDEDLACEDSDASDPKAIRAHATKMLFWADKAIQQAKTSRSIVSSIASSRGTDLKPTMNRIPPVPSQAVPIPGRPPRNIEVVKKQTVVISNLDQVDNQEACCCQSSLFNGNAEHVEFYLPKLGIACTCGKYTEPIEVGENEDPTALENILRPWQVEFLKSKNILTAVELVHVHCQRGAILAKSMRKWRKANKMVSVKTKSCGIALHIWSRTCKTVVRSVREQRANGVANPTKPKFLDVSLPSDSRSMSTLGYGSVVEMDSNTEN